MKLLDILGTSAESFSLGLGENKIELRSIDGSLYFRNFGTGWQKASSESLQESLRLRTWSPGLIIGQNEIFLYNNSIWFSKNTVSASNFIEDSKEFVKIADTINFLKIDVSSVTSTNLLTEVSNSIFIYGSTNLSFSRIYLPDAKTINNGRQFLFTNTSNAPIRIYKHQDESSYFSVQTDQSLGLILINNSTSIGEWATLSFSGSGGGGGGTYQLDVTLTLSNYSPPTNPFQRGDFVYYDPIVKYWKFATSDNTDLSIFGIVTSFSGNKITVAFFGQIDFDEALTLNGSSIIEGNTYYLSDTLPGKFTDTPGNVKRKLFIAISTNSIFLLPDQEYERFNEQKIYTLDNNSSVNLNEGYSYRLDGHIHDDLNLTTFSGYIYQSTPVEALIESSSDIVFDSDSPGGLCFFMDGNNLKMKNTLGSSKKIIIYRKKIK